MLIEQWPIERVIPYARNARTITPAAVDKVAASIQEFGWRQPIVVDAQRVIIAGHDHYTLQEFGTGDAADMARDWVMEESADGLAWDQLDQQTAQIAWAAGETRTYPVPYTIHYRYFRLTVSANNGGSNLVIAELHLYGVLRYRPLVVSVVLGSTGGVVNSGNAADGLLSTYAAVQRSHFSSLGSGPLLQLTTYAEFEDTTAPSANLDPLALAQTGHALAHATGPFRWRPKVSIRDLYNGCKGTYVSPVNKWQVSDFPPYAQDTLHGYASGSPLDPFGDANLAADGGERRWLDIQLPFTISWSMAQRLAKIELMRRRQQGTGTFVYDMALYQATVLDIFQMTLPLLGWTNKLLEISAFRFTLEKVNSGGREVTLLGTQLDVQDTDPSVYAWAITEELSPEGYQQASMPTNVGTLDDLYTVNGT